VRGLQKRLEIFPEKSQKIQPKSGVIVAEPLYTDNLKISHDLVMFFKK